MKNCLRYFLILCSLGWTASAQSRPQHTPQTTRGTFKIGTPFNETVQRMGGKLPWGAYSFVRRTQTNEYKISLHYGEDDSASRLHPARRLESAQIAVDRPKPTTELLPDIPEAIELCKSGCVLMTIFVVEGNYRPYIVAYAEHPDRRAIASRYTDRNALATDRSYRAMGSRDSDAMATEVPHRR